MAATQGGLKGYLKKERGMIQLVAVDLEKTSAEVIVRGFVAHLSLFLEYKNQSKDACEVSYTCPVDARAAIYNFEAKIDERIVKAQCLEKKKAEETYKKAVEAGHSAIIGERDEAAGDVFHLSLGNLPPGKSAELTLKMVMELPVGIDGAIWFTLPSVFNPRYCPAEQQGPSTPFTVSDGPIIQSQSKFTMDIKAEIRGSLKIARVVSQSDPINVSLTDEETTAEITQDGGFKCDHDWSFQIYYQTPHKAVALQESGDRSSKSFFKDDLVMLNFFPELPLEAYSPHNELFFLVDRSGSMQGSKMAKARSTLLLFLKSLPPGCRFNIISFGSSYESLFQTGSERYTEKTLATAMGLQRSMDADMGGTEIFEALKFIYSKDLTPGYARQLIMLTDGEVWNLDQIFELISRHANETRVFAVGIGEGASTAFVQGVAQAGRGRYEMVAHEEQLHTKVMGLVSSMLQESVQDIEVKCDTEPTQNITLIPKVPPVIFGGQHLILYARLTPKTVIKSVKISGKVGDKTITCNVPEESCKVLHDSNLCLHRLAAKAQLKHWELEDTEGVKEDMTDLSVTSGVVCRHTALVGVDQDDRIIDAGKGVRNESQPIMQFSMNWGGVTSSFTPQSHVMLKACEPIRAQGCMFGRPGPTMASEGSFDHAPPAKGLGGMFGSAAPATAPRGLFGSAAPAPASSGLFGSAVPATATGGLFGSASPAPPPPPVQMKCESAGFTFGGAQSSALLVGGGGAPNLEHLSKRVGSEVDSFEEEQTTIENDELMDMVSTQNFDGSWKMEDCLKIIHLSRTEFKALDDQQEMSEDCLATALCLAFLELRYSNRKSEWHLLALKGRQFLDLRGPTGAVIDICKNYLKQLLNFTTT